MFVDENHFDSYGYPPPKLNQINKGTYSEYHIQKNDSYCAAYCLYVLYLTQIIGFKKRSFEFILSDIDIDLFMNHDFVTLINEKNRKLFSSI